MLCGLIKINNANYKSCGCSFEVSHQGISNEHL